MKAQTNDLQPAGRTLSTDEMAQVSGGASATPGASAIAMHNPPGYLTHNPPDDLTGRAGLAVPPDPY